MSLLESELSGYINAAINPFLNLCSTLFILFLLGIFVFFIFKKFKKSKKAPAPTQEEVEELIKNWNPAPLHQELTELQKLNINVPIVSSLPASYITVNGKRSLNLATSNYFGLVQDELLQKAANDALYKYGCGSCGPRGFYGTIDVHLILEELLAKFLGTEEAIIYSSGFATMASVVPTFSKREDIIFSDMGIHFGLKTGIHLSRSTTKWFKHNDMADLERLLEEVYQEDLRTKRKITRRFLVIEGLYQNYGDIAPLDRIFQLKEKYCFRIMMDDSHGIGVLGTSGGGTCQHFGIPTSQVEFLLSSMGNSLASVGGFCCGSKLIVDHQRLNSSGYVFSASLPPYLSASAIEAVKAIQSKPDLALQLQTKAKLFRKAISDIQGLTVCGNQISPLIHLRLKPSGNSEAERFSAETLLQQIVDQSLEENIALTRAKYVASEDKIPDPSISIFISATHTEDDLIKSAEKIKLIAKQVLLENNQR